MEDRLQRDEAYRRAYDKAAETSQASLTSQYPQLVPPFDQLV